MKIIKSFEAPGYKVRLDESSNGLYYVSYEQGNEKPSISNGLQDFNTACIVFDKKLSELQGH